MQRQTKPKTKMLVNFRANLIFHDLDHFIDVFYAK